MSGKQNTGVAEGQPETAKKTRVTGANNTNIVIKTVEEAGNYIKKFRSQVREQTGKMFNRFGFVSGDVYESEAQALINMGVVIADALGRSHPAQLVLLSDICNATARRIREDQVRATFEPIAATMKMTLDEFAKTQTNPQTKKHFANYAELAEHAIANAPAARPVAAA